MNISTATASLNTGASIPLVGLGTVLEDHDDEQKIVDAMIHALRVGYRTLDTAMIYHNEAMVGRAIRESGVPREDIFLITKVWNEDVRNDTVDAALDRSLELLGFDYVDLYLVHWPIEGKLRSTWTAMERGQEDGRTRAIGTANYMPHHYEDMSVVANIRPALNQIEYHPWFQQREVVAYCVEREIQVQAWRPLVKGGLFGEVPIVDAGRAHEKTSAQVILRWAFQNGVATIPKSSNHARIEENAQIFDFELTNDEMAAIDGLDAGRRQGGDPDNFDF